MLLELDGSMGAAMVSCSSGSKRAFFCASGATSSVVVLTSIMSKLASSVGKLEVSHLCFQRVLGVPADRYDPIGARHFELHVHITGDSHELDKSWAAQESVVVPFEGDHLKAECLNPKIAAVPKMTSSEIWPRGSAFFPDTIPWKCVGDGLRPVKGRPIFLIVSV